MSTQTKVLPTNLLLRKLIEKDITMSLVEIGGGCPVTSYIMDEDNRNREVVVSSRFVNSDFIASLDYEQDISTIIPEKICWEDDIVKAMYEILDIETRRNMGEYINTAMCTVIGSLYSSVYIPAYIMHWWKDKIMVYHLIVYASVLNKLSRDYVIGRIGAAIAAHPEEPLPPQYLTYDKKLLVKEFKEYVPEERRFI